MSQKLFSIAHTEPSCYVFLLSIMINSLSDYYAALHLAVQFNFDALLIYLATRAAGSVDESSLRSIVRRGVASLSLHASFVPTAFFNLYLSALNPRRAVEWNSYQEILASDDPSRISESHLGLILTRSLPSLIHTFQASPASSLRMYPAIPVRAALAGYTTKLSSIFQDDFRRTADVDHIFLGLSGMLPAVEFPNATQEDVARSTLGYHLGGRAVSTDTLYETPIYAVSYVHRNHERDSLCKMDEAAWGRVNRDAAYTARSAGYAHYMLWFDGVLRHQRARPNFDNEASWLAFGLLPYALFHTVCDEVDTAVSAVRFWPFVERALASATGNLHVTAADGAGVHRPDHVRRLSPASALRMVALLPQVCDGSLAVSYAPDAEGLRDVLSRCLTGDWGLLECELSANQGSVTPPPRPSTSDQRVAAELAWVALHAQGLMPGLTAERATTGWRFTMAAGQDAADVMHDLAAGPLYDAVPRRVGLQLSELDPGVEVRCFNGQMAGCGTRDSARVISLGLVVPTSAKAIPLPYNLRAAEVAPDGRIEVEVLLGRMAQLTEEGVELSMTRTLVSLVREMSG